MKSENITIDSEERKGLWVMLILLAITWGGITLPYPIIQLISWVSMGLIIFTFWRIIDGLLNRNKSEGKEDG